MKSFSGIAVAQNSSIERSIFESLHHARCERLMQLQVDPRISLSISTKDRRQGRQHARTDEPNIERSHFAPPDAASLIHVSLHVAQGPTRPQQERLTRRSQTDRPRGSQEQPVAKDLFELHNLLR